MPTLDGTNAIVVGASRGLGRGVAQSLSAAGASVLAIARGQAGLDELHAADPSIAVLAGDAADPSIAERPGVSEAQYVANIGAPVTPEVAGAAFVELAGGELSDDVAYLLTGGAGLAPLPARG
jgi:NAD(P)-dependent dehydrogenase (short-subunit alcohol dehydrogenase family)